MLVGLSPRDLPLRWEDMMHNGLEPRLQMSNFAFEAYRGCRQNLRLVLQENPFLPVESLSETKETGMLF